MKKLLPNLYSYVKNTHRIISSDENEELNYRISSYINKEYDVSKEILEITFEELINTMIDGKELLFSFGTIGINKKKSKYYCTLHRKFRRFYADHGRRKGKTHS
jgi:hypothetical protein